MPSFAIVAEGVTDQIVIEWMIEQLCGDDADVNFLQPARDATDRHHAAHGGWELVFEYCRHRAADALATNDYLIVQIDTDCGEHERYGLPLAPGGVARSQADLVQGASTILAAHIGDPLYADEQGRILFAVAVHSLESWLLLLRYGDANPMTGFKRLSRELQREGARPLEKTAEYYRSLLKGMKKKDLTAPAVTSLGLFLAELQARCQPATPASDEPSPKTIDT